MWRRSLWWVGTLLPLLPPAPPHSGGLRPLSGCSLAMYCIVSIFGQQAMWAGSHPTAAALLTAGGGERRQQKLQQRACALLGRTKEGTIQVRKPRGGACPAAPLLPHTLVQVLALSALTHASSSVPLSAQLLLTVVSSPTDHGPPETMVVSGPSWDSARLQCSVLEKGPL